MVSRAVASLLRLADADLKDAELLSSGRHPGNAPTLLQLASQRLVQAVLATEHGWPLAGSGTAVTLIPAENPLKEAVSNLVATCRMDGPPAVAANGSPPTPPDPQELRTNILAVRALLKNSASVFQVDLLGVGVAGKIAPLRPAVQAAPKQDRIAAKPEPKPKPVPFRPAQQSAPPRAAPPAGLPRSGADGLARASRVSGPDQSPPPAPEPHEVEGRASIEVKQGSASLASTPFWSLMDRWGVPDQAALDLIGHPGGLTKKATRPRFRLVGEEAELLKGFQEIEAALKALGLAPGNWLHQSIKGAPFGGATPLATLTKSHKQGVHDVLRFLLQHGLRVSMSDSA